MLKMFKKLKAKLRKKKNKKIAKLVVGLMLLGIGLTTAVAMQRSDDFDISPSAAGKICQKGRRCVGVRVGQPPKKAKEGEICQIQTARSGKGTIYCKAKVQKQQLEARTQLCSRVKTDKACRNKPVGKVVTYKKKKYTCKDTGKKSGKKPICKAVPRGGDSDAGESYQTACKKAGGSWCQGKWAGDIVNKTCQGAAGLPDNMIDAWELSVNYSYPSTEDYGKVMTSVCCKKGCKGSDSDGTEDLEKTPETEKDDEPSAFQRRVSEIIKKYFPMVAEFATPVR